MASPDDDSKLPVAHSDVRREISAVIARDGVNNLKSKAVREHLKNTFNTDFTAYKSQVDEVIKDCITALMAKPEPKPDPKPAPVVAKKEEKYESSDSDSDPGVASDDRTVCLYYFHQPAVKRKATARKPAKDDEPEDEDLDLHSAVKRRRRAATKTTERKIPRRSEGGPKKKRAAVIGRFSRFMWLNDDLSALTGKRYMPRSEVVKAIWAYVKDNNLKDPKNGQFTICDDVLRAVFKKNRFKTFGMMKMIADGRIMMKPEEISEEAVEEAKECEAQHLAAINAARDAEAANGGAEEGGVKKEEEEGAEEEEEDGAEEEDGD
ncbi:hypothetical protein PFISCL1PPCAC_9967, partial [Pristionchus fissidentatus]